MADKPRFPWWPSEKHPAPRPYSWVYSEPDGIAYVYDANGKQIAFGPDEASNGVAAAAAAEVASAL